MQPYQFERIYPQMAKEFGKMGKGEEEAYTMCFFPVMCLLRIKDSIDTWEKHSGSDGYFNFIEGLMGSQINGTEMNFTIMSPEFLE